MTSELERNLQLVKEYEEKLHIYDNATAVLSYDQETICPPAARETQGEVMAFLSNEAFKIRKEQAFIDACEYLYAHRDELSPREARYATLHHQQYLQIKNITPEIDHEMTLIYNKAFVDWLEAKEKKDFGIFAPSLEAVRKVNRQSLALREYDPEDPLKDKEAYDVLLDNFEAGLSQEDYDLAFNAYKERIIPLLKKIMQSGKKIRTDFLARPVSEDQQRQAAQYLLEVLHYDFNRGAFTTTEHPFTSNIARNDIRLTTKYVEGNFSANLFTIIHECGHALFMQLQPQEDYDHFINDSQTSGMHESVSRFYENRLGRSKAFVHLIYPKMKEIFREAMADVTEREFYEALNTVEPSLVRVDADEFTYTFHVIIRYEIEKEIVSGRAKIEDLPRLWNQKYREYLGVEPENDAEGILQDVHWTFGFGYFPTYAIGNMYNAMYIRNMQKELDLDELLGKGDFETINAWMAEHVFKDANMINPKEWIRRVSGEDFSPEPFLDYLEKKYSEIYEI